MSTIQPTNIIKCNRNENPDLSILIQMVRSNVSEKMKGSSVLNRFLKLAKFEQSDRDKGIRVFLTQCIATLKRQNRWRQLPRIGKGILTLSATLQLRFKGQVLLRSLANVLSEAVLSISPLYQFWIRGADLACRLSAVAYSWGNKAAFKWRFDDNYILYLGMSKSSVSSRP